MRIRRFWIGVSGCGLLLAGPLVGPAARAQTAPAAPATSPAAASGLVELLPLPVVVPLAGTLVLGFRVGGPGAISHSEFPELEGFRKAGLSTTTTTRLLPGGGRRTERIVRQRYLPYAEGNYVVPAFSLIVNGLALRGAGGRLRVGGGAAPNPTNSTNPTNPADQSAASGTGQLGAGSADQLLGLPKPRKFYEPPDAGRLALEADRVRVFAGQGVQVSLYFYLRPADQALLNFYDFNNQLTSLTRQLRQPGAWEVAAEASPEPDTVRPAGGGPALLRFRLARRTYYPLTARTLAFPALQLTLTKLWLLKNPQPGDTERLAHYKTYVAPPLRVAVRGLPGPPLALVGTLAVRETLSRPRPRTGEAFGYVLDVEGSGSAAALTAPAWHPRPGLEVFGPDVTQEPLPGGRFRKRFRYRLLSQRPGLLPLDSLWRIAYFDPAAGRYDTLRARLRPLLSGAPAAGTPAASPADDPFYGPALADADAHLQPLDVYRQVSRYAAALVGVLLVVAAVGAWRARR